MSRVRELDFRHGFYPESVEVEDSSSLDGDVGYPDNSKCPLLNLPHVVQDILLGYLSVREYLTLRRVCKDTMDWVQKKRWNQKELCQWQCYSPKITSDRPYGLKYAVAMKVPVTRYQIMINEKGPRELVYKFLAMYGPCLKTLHFRRCDENDEIELSVRGSGNSCACTRKKVCFKCKDRVSILDVLFMDEIRFPFVFQKLNELKLDFVVKNREEAKIVVNIIYKCESMNYFKLPLVDLEEDSPDFVEMPYILIEEFLNPVIAYVQRRGRNNLKAIDLEAWRDSDILDHGMICKRLIDLLTEGSVFGVRFVNVLADIIERNVFSRQDWQFMIDQDHPDIRPYQMIQSLVNPGPKLLTFLKFPHLQELSVGCSDYQSYTVPNDILSRVAWPDLKSINIDTTPPIHTGVVSFRIGDNVVLGVPGEARKSAWARTMSMISGFNGTVSRRSVEKITINEKSARYFEENFHTCGLEFPPTTLASAFTELTVLEIERWDSAGDEGFLLLWRALRKLNSLKIKNCFRLSDYGFIGKREATPTFHKLRYLKKLEIVLSTTTLYHVTDRTLKLVFSHMPLTDFRLEGCIHADGKGIGRITEEGILAMADGKLAKSLQVFHLDVDASPWLTPRRCGELSRLFRCTI